MAVVLTIASLFVANAFGAAIPDPDMKNLGYYTKFSAYYEMDSYPRKIALLTDDLQEEYRPFSMDIVPKVQGLMDVFRENDLPIIWSFWGRRPNDGWTKGPAMDRFYGPEGMESQKNGLYIFGEDGCDILHEIAPKTEAEKEMSFTSMDLNMFWNFDDEGKSIMEEKLKAHDIDTIVLTGSWTDECMLAMYCVTMYCVHLNI